jgi:hypothetical protein
MIKLNESILLKTALPSLSVLLGVVLTNGVEQANLSNIYTKVLATIAFVGGWLVLPFMLSIDKSRKWIYFVLSYSILFSASALKYFMVNNKQPPMLLAMLFMLSWPILGYFIATPSVGAPSVGTPSVGGTLFNKKSVLGIFAGVCAVVSMVVALPIERKQRVTDGVGMSLFTIAWTLVTLLNSSH